MLKRLRLGVLILVMLLAALPLIPARAQDGLNADELALVKRALAGLEAVNSYQSFTADIDFDWSQEWAGGVSGQPAMSQTMRFSRQEQIAYLNEAVAPNTRQVIAITQSAAPQGDSYTLRGEVRLVDGTTYTNAAYEEAAGNVLKLPSGWYAVSDANSFVVWPGLQLLVNPEIYADPAAEAVYRTLGAEVQMARAAYQHVTSAASESVTLEDGTRVEKITLMLDRTGAEALGLITVDPGDELFPIILDATEGELAAVYAYFDAEGFLVAQDFELTIDVPEVDLTGAPGIPDGFTIRYLMAQSFTARFTQINAPLERVAAPDLGSAQPFAYRVPEEPETLPWWNDRVFYEIFVRSFYDSDGDGIGDLRGVIGKLDYLNDGDPATTDDLGVTGIWLMPVAQSPSYHGYDTTDYFTIEEDYGTNQDFRDLVQAAHERGIVVIVDLVLNHTSNEHPWFVASGEGDPQFADWYIWSNTNPGTFAPWGSPAWHPLGDRFYFGMFWEGMPDLNYNTPAVTEQMNDVIRFWLDDMGADGFRLDAIRHLFEAGATMQNVPATHTWLEEFYVFVHTLKPEALTVGEVWDTSAAIRPYVGDEVDIAFEFDFATAIISAAQLKSAEPLVYTLSTVLDTYPPAQYATFLTNHDQNRVMSQLSGDLGAARTAATVLLTSPGVPFIYYGEEVGMVGEKPDERIRTPMQWDSTRITGGFSAVAPWEMMSTGYRANNVATMTGDPASLLSHYRAMVDLRADHPALRSGAIQLAQSSDPRVYAALRYAGDEVLLVIVNFAAEPVSDYSLTVTDSLLSGAIDAVLLLGEGEAAAPALDAGGAFAGYVPLLELPPQSSFVIQLK